MGKAAIILCLGLFAGGCASNPTPHANISSDQVAFLSAQPPHSTRVGWTSFNDHLTLHYAEDAVASMSRAAANKGANVVVLLGIDPPDIRDHLGPFDVHGFLATVYVWADLYYCPGLTDAPAQKIPPEMTPLVQFASTAGQLK